MNESVSTKPHYYMNHVHKEYLFKICKDSFLELDYFGGPEVKCDCMEAPEVIECVRYDSGDPAAQEWESSKLSCGFGCSLDVVECFKFVSE